MGMYTRGSRIWFSWTDAHGKRHREPSPFEAGQEALAAKAFGLGQAKISAEKKAMAGGPRAHSDKTLLDAYANDLFAQRELDGIDVRSERSMFQCHIGPALGHLALGAIEVHDVRAFVRLLKTTKVSETTGRRLGARTVRHVVGLLGTIMSAAADPDEGVIAVSPYRLKKGDLPKKRDVNPLRRKLGVFDHNEVETLISDDAIREDWRVYYAIAFMTGNRPGETSALRWECWDQTTKPIGELTMYRAYSTRARKERESTKTGGRRVAPVHPTLARVLAEWKLNGWQRLMGCAPRPNDLILPSRRLGGCRRSDDIREALQAELKARGWRDRWSYDTRATFVSLAIEDGAIGEIIQDITHPPSEDGAVKTVFGGYSRFSWEARCAEVLKLKIALREGGAIPFRRAASGQADGATMTSENEPGEASQARDITSGGSETLAQRCHGHGQGAEIRAGFCASILSRNQRAGVGSSRPTPTNAAESQGAAASDARSSGPVPTSVVTMCQSPAEVGAGPALERPADPVAEALVAAQKAWSGVRDSSALRVRLLDLLRLLESSPKGGKS